MRDVICFALVAALGVVGMVGCGGNVVVDGPGTGGGGGEGGNGTTTSGSTTSSTTVSPPSYCASFCNQYEKLGCLGGTTVEDCANGCVDAFGQFEACTQELQALYDCILGEVGPGCALTGDACQNESIVFGECTNSSSSCFEYACDYFDGGCYCDGECGGSYLESQCKDAGGSYFCSCLMDGQEVGVCEGSPECGIFNGCCSGYFFEKK